MADCDDVLSVFDYSDVANVARVATLTAADAGWDGSSFETTCDPLGETGTAPAAYGCATSAASGKAYCHLGGNGRIAVVELDADPPVFSLLTTAGRGGGAARAGPGGVHVYVLQREPREGSEPSPGGICQIGQLVVIDTAGDTIAAEVPLLYDGPSCRQRLAGSDQDGVEPAQIAIEGLRMYVTLAGTLLPGARVRRELVLDLSDPAAPVQRASIALGESVGGLGVALAGDRERLFVANNLDGTVATLRVSDGALLGSFGGGPNPVALATWQDRHGPSRQTGPIE
jgi:hypothetical protein